VKSADNFRFDADTDKEETVYEKVYQGDTRTASRLMRDIEEGLPQARAEMKRLYPQSGKARIIGITGSPGAGKSTLCDCLISHYRKQGCKVGVVAIDPSSPFSGGAILGDRIRMSRHADDEGVFIRSLATRGQTGGLSRAACDVSAVMEAWGAQIVIVETVGAGQAEVEVRRLATSSIVVLTPGMGDEVQAIKAGIMEIADIFVVNKADREGVERTVNDIRGVLELLPDGGPQVWRPQIVKTVAFRNEGIAELGQALDGHHAFMLESGVLAKRARERAELQLFDLLHEHVQLKINAVLEKKLDPQWREMLASRRTDPYTLAEGVLKEILNGDD